MSGFDKSLDVISKVLFTNRCEICGDVIELDEKRCECCKNIKLIQEPICESCGCNKDDCTCNKRKNEFKRAVAPYYYEDRLIPAIHRLKDSEMSMIAKHLSYQMACQVKKYYGDINFDYIVYVPTTEFKIRYRGYNQARLLAEGISKEINVKVEEFLYKSRYTKTLHKNKSKQKRASIVYGSFDIYDDCKSLVEDKTFLLVDDVKTTGSTLNECAKMLNIYGAKAVYAVTSAITKERVK